MEAVNGIHKSNSEDTIKQGGNKLIFLLLLITIADKL